MSKENYENNFEVLINSHEDYQAMIDNVIDNIKQTYTDSDGKNKPKNIEYIKQLVPFIEKILGQDQYSALQKYCTLRLLSDSIEAKVNTFLVHVLKNQKLLEILEKYAKMDQTKSIFKSDPSKIGPYFMNNLLFSIKFWASTWPEDAQGKQTKFKELYDNLSRVKFPDKKMALPLNSQSSQQAPKTLNNPHAEKITGLYELAQNLIEIQVDQKNSKECKEILNDFQIEVQNAQTQVLQLQQQNNSLNQQQKQKVNELEEFFNTYSDAFQVFNKQPNNDKNLLQFQNTINANSYLITGLKKPKPQNNQNNLEEQKYQSSQMLKKDTDLINHMIEVCSMIITIMEQTTQAQEFKEFTLDYKVEIQKNQTTLMEIDVSGRLTAILQKKIKDLNKFIEAYMEAYQVFSLITNNSNLETLKIVVQNNQHLITGQPQKVASRVTSQPKEVASRVSTGPKANDWDFKTDDPFQYGNQFQSGVQKQNNNDSKKVTKTEHDPFQYGNQFQPAADQNKNIKTYVKQDNINTFDGGDQSFKKKENKEYLSHHEDKSSFNQLFDIQGNKKTNLGGPVDKEIEDHKKSIAIRQQQQKSHTKTNRNNFQNQEEFPENFSDISTSTVGHRDFTVRFQDILEKKTYKGRQVHFNPQIFAPIETCGLTQREIRRFKLSNIKAKCILYETPEIQIGVKSESVYDILSNKNKLNLHFFVGNKTVHEISNLELDYQGDQTCSIWVAPQEQTTIRSKNQLKEELIFSYTRQPYDLVNAEVKFQIDDKHYDGIFFLPNLLTRFMNFKETDLKVFKSHWKLKQDNILKSEIFKINPNLIRHPSYLLRYFPKSMELTSLEEFNKQDSAKIKYYKLGGVFELDKFTIDYMIKICVRPDYSAVIQIIPFSSYATTAETVINHLVYIFKKSN